MIVAGIALGCTANPSASFDAGSNTDGYVEFSSAKRLAWSASSLTLMPTNVTPFAF
jgi:hypothetical protein